MPELLGYHFELKRHWFVDRIDDTVEAKKNFEGPAKISTMFFWDQTEDIHTIEVAIILKIVDQTETQTIFRLVMNAEYIISGSSGLKGKMVLLPIAGWLAIGRDAWTLLEAEIHAQPTPVAELKFDPPADSDIIPPEDFGDFAFNESSLN